VKEVLERFGLIELFGYLSPGVILLFSFTLWIKPEFSRLLGQELANQQFIIGSSLLVLAYALGMVIAWFSSAGSDLYLRVTDAGTILNQIGGSWLRRMYVTVSRWLLFPFFRIAVPEGGTTLGKDSLTERKIEISEDLRRFTHIQGLSVLESQWDLLAIYRIVVSDVAGEKATPLIAEAESVHSRMLFAMGVSLTLWLIVIQLILSLVFSLYSWSDQLPDIAMPLAISMIILGVLGSFGLRWVASRWWQYELILTCRLSQTLSWRRSR